MTKAEKRYNRKFKQVLKIIESVSCSSNNWREEIQATEKILAKFGINKPQSKV